VNLIVEGIKYQLHAKKRQGIHSPFVYDLVDKGLRYPLFPEHENILSAFDKKQRSDLRKLSIQDLGSGSKHMGKERTIKGIHRVSSSGKRFGNLLYKLCAHYKPERILELGTSLGRGTLAMHLGNTKAQITSIEGDASITAVAQENMNTLAIDVNQIQLYNRSFFAYLEEHRKGSFDLVYIDGHHDGRALLEYCEALENRIHDQSLLILDDIRWSKSMFNAWKTLCTSEKFNVSIDFFRMGMLVKRSGQRKEHFVLRS
jgi:predicted O-methyltransferase YrrM